METKPEAIMDVNADAVASALRERGVTRLIHGHTHRPARHAHEVDGRVCERQVLADWYRKASYLEVSEKGMTARA
jgi:UDP-2,3-diacylglucosamine hydrolase